MTLFNINTKAIVLLLFLLLIWTLIMVGVSKNLLSSTFDAQTCCSPLTKLMTIESNTKLANQMSRYSALLVISNLTGHTPVLPEASSN